ncbi:4-amino-4-deoxy-L-arabinose transferase [Nocardioides sp.]|uniref:uridine kinase family protein n=1 Tax=Nocardioides sp. TaxID=35761 RepID=UPI0026360080|nr:4-amino-4-deoxy-L-arabinose transferase [Nocardioides sp.]MDI6911976.1 4-amino-4-deoxy-L-arabinose transferase [Nocardioides sp.]
MNDPSDGATRLLDLARSRPPTLGSGRLICIDGPAGSGKTTLAAAVTARAPEARAVHLDDLYDGWDGLPRLTDQLGTLLEPLAREETGHYRRYDWDAGRFAERVQVAPGPLLVLEGVGSGAATYAHLVTALAWVEAPADVRLRRGLARDGESLRARWLRWQADEAALFARERTRDRADLRVDTTP